jgi:hypothetical protein
VHVHDALVGRIGRLLGLYPTRRAAAMAGGVSTDQIARYAMGRSAAPFPVLARLAEGVDVSLDWVALGTGPMLRAGRADAVSPVGLPVLGLRDIGARWYEAAPLTVRVAAQPGLPADRTLAVMAPDDRLKDDGVGAGHICYCVAGLPPLPDDIIYLERADRRVALRRFLGLSGQRLRTAGPEGEEALALEAVAQLAPVVLIRRKW